VLRVTRPDALPESHPASGKWAGPEGAAAFVCRRNVCGLPMTDEASLSAQVTQRATHDLRQT
jgi:uncharacterized protein